jgi:Cu(I)/Ag(I) efflux system protein CusF
MKRLALLAFALSLSPLALGQSGGTKGMEMKGMDMKGMEKEEKSGVHKATGVVTKVDAAKGRVTIKHDPVPSLNWPTMSMVFVVKDKSMLEKMPKDKKIDFEFTQQGKDYVVTSVK